MTSNLDTEVLDCRGQRCPGPILALSRRARTMASEGGLLEVRANDPAFPLDLKSWCRSVKAELVHLDQDGPDLRALVRIPSKSMGPRNAADASQGGAAATVSVVHEPSPTQLDCRGTRCPEPILRIARLARSAEPGTLIEILADDEAFPLDIQSWCRSADATLVEMDPRGDGSHRARVRTKGGSRNAATPPAASLTTAVLPPAPPPVVAVAPLAPLAEDPSRPDFVVDLRMLDADGWDDALQGAARRAADGQCLRVYGESNAAVARIVGFCATQGHRLQQLQTAGGVTADVVLHKSATTALVPAHDVAMAKHASACADCTLLVLHNDHEALLAALLVAVGAATQGKQVVIFFTFWGLNLLRGDEPNAAMPKQKVSWMQRMMKMMMPKGPNRQSLGQMNFGGAGKMMLGSIMKKQNIMSLPELMATAEEQGVRFIACTMSMEVMGITKRDLSPRTNLEYGGVAAFVEAAHGAGMSLVF